MKFPVFDLHCDTACNLAGFGLDEPALLKQNAGHIDLIRAGELAGYAQCFACFTTYSDRMDPVDAFEKQLAAIHRELARNTDKIKQAYTPQEIETNLAQGCMSAILTIEGPAGFGFDPALLEDLYKVGFRISTLGWNEQNPLTGSHVTGGGLTDKGVAYIKELQRLGMLVDVSHISDEGFWDIIRITQGPVIASHSNSRAVHDTSRNLTDDMFCAICETGGVAGINLYTDFLGEHANISTIVLHILHWLELDPTGKHIALGGDLDGCETLPKGFSGVADYEKLADALLSSGLTQSMVMDIFWNNAIGVMKDAVYYNKK